ncbi:MAG TPA: PRC-barrel domain-containing protein [Gaiellaceae bacterium]|nr:PRC-barrel domain-containing protein [Gaiellaceae bacterium]
MRLELDKPVSVDGEEVGKLGDLVVDPLAKRVTHLVVKPHGGEDTSHLVPIELASSAEQDGKIALTCSRADFEALPAVEEFTYLRLGEVKTDDPNWDVGVSDILALPYYDSTGLAGPVEAVGDMGVVWDRVPKGEVELRRSSRVMAADGHYLGDVDGFLLDDSDHITHFVLERGHLWGRREVTVPIGSVASVESDVVTLSLSKDEVGALPSHRVRRW